MKQSSRKFQGCISGYEVKMDLTQNRLGVLLVPADDSRRVYELIVDEGHAVMKGLKKLFRKVEDFMKYLQENSQNPERVSVDDWGTLTVYVYKTLRPKVPPFVAIPTARLQNKSSLKRGEQIAKTIQQYQAQNSILKRVILEASQEHDQDSHLIENYRNLLLQAKQAMIVGKQPVRIHCETTKENIVALGRLESEIDMFKKGLAQMRELFMGKLFQRGTWDGTGQFGWQLRVTVDRNNKYLAEHYLVQDNSVIKINKYGSAQVLGRQVFPQGRSHYYLYVKRINWSIFSIGVCNQNRRNYENSYLSPECITYFAKTGCIWERGMCRGGGPTIPQHVQLRVVVDRPKATVKWFMNRQEIGSTIMRRELTEARLVPYIQLNYPENEVVFNSYVQQ